ARLVPGNFFSPTGNKKEHFRPLRHDNQYFTRNPYTKIQEQISEVRNKFLARLVPGNFFSTTANKKEHFRPLRHDNQYFTRNPYTKKQEQISEVRNKFQDAPIAIGIGGTRAGKNAKRTTTLLNEANEKTSIFE